MRGSAPSPSPRRLEHLGPVAGVELDRLGLELHAHAETSTSAPGSSAATFASSSAMSSSSSSPTFTTASTGLLVSRKCDASRSRCVGVEAGAVDRRALGQRRRRRRRARRPRRPATDRLGRLLRRGRAGPRPSRGRPAPARSRRPAGARAGRRARARRRRAKARSTKHDGVDLADAAEEPVAQALTLAGPLDQAADVDDLHRRPAPRSCSCDMAARSSRRWSGTLDTPTLGSLVAKAYGRGQRAGVGQGVEERRLAGVGQADEAEAFHVGRGYRRTP